MIRLPAFPIAGGCACGAVRYEITAPPIAAYACCCKDCQTLTGSAFSLALPVFRKDFRITLGEPGSWVRTAQSGNEIPQRLCATCGVRLYTEPPLSPETVTVRPGTLDEADWIQPAAAYWMSSAQAWTRFPEGTLLYDTQPDDFRPVLRAWRGMLAS